MPVDISSFVTSFKTDLARPSRFDVTIPLPVQLLPYNQGAKYLNVRCESTELPSRTFATADRKIGSVPIQRVPYQTTYNDLTMTFIVSGDMSEKILFDAWMEIINPVSNYNFTYRRNYCTEIKINQYDLQNNKTYEALLVDAYPISVNQLDLDWTSDSYHKLSVVFAYSYWTNVNSQNIVDNIMTQGLNGLVNVLTPVGGIFK